MADWQVIDTGVHSAEENMRLDAQMLEGADLLPGPTLHFYEWKKPSITYGYFTDPSRFLDVEFARTYPLDVVRRPTGGGIVFHLFDMAFSVIVPAHVPQFSLNTLDNYAFVNQAVLSSVQQFLEGDLSLTAKDAPAWDPSCSSFCMAKPTKYDVIWQGKKVAGAAQRKTKKGFLHQGTISLVMPPLTFLDQILLADSQVKSAMLNYTCPLLPQEATPHQVEAFKLELRRILTIQLTGSFVNMTFNS